MENLIIINEKIKNKGYLEKNDLELLEKDRNIQNSQDVQNLINNIKNSRSIKIAGTHSKIDVLENILKQKNIEISKNASFTLLLSHVNKSVELNYNQDITIIDGLEIAIKDSKKLESLQKYISKTIENSQFKDGIALSLELAQLLENGNLDEWEDIFDELGSQNPKRDIREYSNTREVYNTILSKLKSKEQSNYRELSEILTSIINKNSSQEYIEKIRDKYRKENDYKEVYKKKRELLIDIANDLSNSLKEEFIAKKMQKVAEQLEKQEFSIGITGVIKAGKSTMINALLGKDILGTAIRPETANLTIIKQNPTPKAIVHFWSKDEWKEIKNSLFDEQGKSFVEISESLKDFNNYIKEESKSIEIDINELDNYTSARKSNSLCNLVKSVELYLPLEFLDNGVSIVDTPGIDDPVVQREIITKKYLNSCSAILHLMNAKQSATQTDIEFIAEALVNHGISSLLIVITRIDTLGSSKEEIDKNLIDIISHTKKEVEKYLNRVSDKDISDVLSKLEFLPLAGKFALQHRIGEGEKALKKGYELKDTGILEIENYINTMLFGEKNERAQLAIKNAYNVIEDSIKLYAANLEEKYSNIGLKKAELDKKIQNLQEEKSYITRELNEIEREILREEKRIKRELEVLKSLFELKFDGLRKEITDEVSNYIIEELFNGNKPDENKIKNDIENRVKEFVSELTNDYRKKSQIILEDSIDFIDTQYAKLKLPKDININMKIDKIEDMGDFAYSTLMFGLGGTLGYIGAFLFGPLGWIGAIFITWWAGDAIDKWRKEKITKQVEDKMKVVSEKLDEMNRKIYDNLSTELEKYDNNLIQYFKEISYQPAIELKNRLNEKEKFLNELKINMGLQEKSDMELKREIEREAEIIKRDINLLREV